MTETNDLVGASFQRWSEPWSRLGFWLSLWDDEGQCIEQCGSAHAFWSALIPHSKPCWHRLRQFARGVRRRPAGVAELDAHCGVFVLTCPLFHRQRPAGSVIACGLAVDFPEEENVARFCDHHRVDREVMVRLALQIPRYAPEQFDAYAALMRQNVESHSANTLACRDVRDLSDSLARAYEELSLLYGLSADMTVSRRPAAVVDKLCAELCESGVAESAAGILDPPHDAGEPAVTVAGPFAIGRESILRLYREVRDRPANAGEALIVNDVAEHPEYAWAAAWLKEFAFVNLDKGDHRFGGILTINRTGTQGFGSEETRLIGAIAERSAAFLQNVHLYEDLEELFMGMLHALVSSIDAKDPYTCGHSQRVAWLSRYLAMLAGIPEAQCQRVYLSGLLHDVGKIGISEPVLCKTGRLTRDEYDEMKRHPEIGARILQGVRQIEDLVPGVLSHHERMDGKGYPHGLTGDEIPMLGRIVCLADSFDAITSSRTYRRARPIQVAVAEIRRCSGTQFDPALTELFLRQDLAEVLEQVNRSGRRAVQFDTFPMSGESA